MSKLTDLPLDEAIRLRWVLRDIRAKRFLISPVASSDLETLTQLGYITITSDLPTLTSAGLDEINYST